MPVDLRTVPLLGGWGKCVHVPGSTVNKSEERAFELARSFGWRSEAGAEQSTAVRSRVVLLISVCLEASRRTRQGS